MHEHERVFLGALGICLCVHLCTHLRVCMFLHDATLSNCVYACICMHIPFKSISVRVSYMCLRVLNLCGPRLPEAGFFKIILTLIKARIVPCCQGQPQV